MRIRRHMITRRLTLLLIAVCTFWFLPHKNPRALAATGDGVRLNLTLREILESDPPETTIVDTLGVSVPFDHESTLRIGNVVIYVTAKQPANSDQSSHVRLSYFLYTTGPTPDQRSDDALVEFGTPLVVESLRGKGKSIYRLLMVPHPAPAPMGVIVQADTALKDAVSGMYFLFHVDSRSRAGFHFLELSRSLDLDYSSLRDSFGITEPGRIDYRFVEGPTADIPLDPRFDCAIDPSRNSIVARYDQGYSGVDAAAPFLLTLYRTWGYAPELLARGASEYLSPSDYEVIADRDSGRTIPLDSLAQTYTFKRQPFPASVHHAASFVRWLISSRSVAKFREVYSRSTDLSVERALWSVYGKTLKELETEWVAYLKKRDFRPAELYRWALRAAGYHRYGEHYNLLSRAIKSADTIPASIYESMGRAAAQLGRWPEAVQYFLGSFKARPNDAASISLLAEALWANGQPNDAEFHLRRLISIDSTAARAYLVLGDIQQLQQRHDSAAALWRLGLANRSDGPLAIDLLLRLVSYERRRAPDSARAHIRRAGEYAQEFFETSHGDLSSLIRCGEAFLAADSTEHALAYLHLAAYAADAPEDLGRVYVDIGNCYDLAGKRQDAVKAYRTVFEIPATHYDARMAQYYINHIYKH